MRRCDGGDAAGGGNAATQTEDGISHGTKREMNDVENRKIKHLIVYVYVCGCVGG